MKQLEVHNNELETQYEMQETVNHCQRFLLTNKSLCIAKNIYSQVAENLLSSRQVTHISNTE